MPENTGCCSMTGNRGFLFTELFGVATWPDASGLMAQQYNDDYSSKKRVE